MYGNSLNLAVDGNRLNVIWDPNGIPNGRLYQQRSLDGGSTWAPVTNHGLQNPSQVAIAGSRVMLTTQSGSGLPITTSIATPQDGGQTWSATYGLVPSNQTVGGYPSVAGPDFYLHFRFFGSQPRAGFVLHNDGSSAQWRQLAADVGAGLFAWPEGCIATTVPPSPATELRAYVLTGHASLGTGTSGLTPKLAGTGLPLLGRSFFRVRCRASQAAARRHGKDLADLRVLRRCPSLQTLTVRYDEWKPAEIEALLPGVSLNVRLDPRTRSPAR